MTLDPIKAKTLSALPGIKHGFYGRQGGVSTGIYSGLNCGYGSSDDASNVAANRTRVAQDMGLSDGKHIISLFQVHSANCVHVSGPWPNGEAPRADAMVCNDPEYALGILTADCGPVLFANAEAGVVGAAHAGWRGALDGVLKSCVLEMEKLGAARQNIHAVLGPTIGQASYEVGPEFLETFSTADPSYHRFFVPGRDDRQQFDLHGFIEMQLQRLDLASIEILGNDTYPDDKRFFSYRRATHRNETDYGRMIATIKLAP